MSDSRVICILFKNMRKTIGGALTFVGIVIFLGWIFTNYYLTNLRLIDKRGIIGKRIVSIHLDKVQDITCKFGI